MNQPKNPPAVCKIFALLLITALLFTSCQTGSGTTQSSTSDTASPEEFTLFGKPITQVDWSNAVSKDFNEPATEEGKYIDQIIKPFIYYPFTPYPESLENSNDTVSSYLIKWALNRYTNGFDDKHIEDFPIVDDSVSPPIRQIPANNILQCLRHDFGNISEETLTLLIRNSANYIDNKDAINDDLYIDVGGHFSYSLVDKVIFQEPNILTIKFKWVNLSKMVQQNTLKPEWEKDVDSILKTCPYRNVSLTVQILKDGWQYLECQALEESA